MNPGKLNLLIHQRATFRQSFDFNADLTNHFIYAQIWDLNRRTKYAEFDIEWTDQTLGQFDLVLPFSVTSNLRKKAVWDLLLEQPNGERYYWLEGDVIIDLGYTEPPEV